MTYSRSLELLTEGVWDPTYGTGSPGTFYASVCHECGALVDDAAKEKHDKLHNKRGETDGS